MSKMVDDRLRSAALVAKATETHGEKVAARLEEALAGYAKRGEPEVDWAQALRLLGRAVSDSADLLAEADDEHQAEKMDDEEPRARRDRAAEALHGELQDLRSVVGSTYGARGLRAIRIVGPVPREHLPLSRLAEAVAEGLGALEGLPAVRRGLTLDAHAYARPLRRLKRDLDEALDEVAREKRELELTQVRKDLAFEEHDRRFSGVAQALQGLFALAGEPALAARVRPSGRRPGRTAEEVLTEENEAAPEAPEGE